MSLAYLACRIPLKVTDYYDHITNHERYAELGELLHPLGFWVR